MGGPRARMDRLDAWMRSSRHVVFGDVSGLEDMGLVEGLRTMK